MTEAEENLADKYTEKIIRHKMAVHDVFDKKETEKEIKESFLAGLKASRPKWHDLRKDPKDLPNGHRVVLNQVGMATQYDPRRGFLGFGGAGIIAWCEIPTYTEE